MDLILRITKTIVCILIFGGVCVGGLVTKTTTLILANSAGPCTELNKINNTIVNCSIPSYMIQDANVMRVKSYLLMMYSMLFAEALTLVYGAYRVLFKEEMSIKWKYFFNCLIPEVIATFSEVILFIRVLPNIDSTLACLMFTLVAFLPFVMSIFGNAKPLLSGQSESDYQRYQNRRKKRKLRLLIPCFVLHILGLVAIGFATANEHYGFVYTSGFAITTVLSLFGCSFRYWENFVTEDILSMNLLAWHKSMDQARFKISFLYSLIRCVIIVGTTFLIFVVWEGDSYYQLDNGGNEELVYDSSTIVSWATYSVQNEETYIALVNVMVTNMFCSLGTWYLGRLACQTMMQKEAYTIPIALVTPIITILSGILANQRTDPKNGGITNLLLFFDLDATYNTMPDNFAVLVDWRCDATCYAIANNSIPYLVLIGVLGFLCWPASIYGSGEGFWNPKMEKMDRTEVLFTKPIYAGYNIAESMMMNRRRVCDESIRTRLQNHRHEKQLRKMSTRRKKYSRRITRHGRVRETPYVYLCATMWHENEREMRQLLTSIMRLDKDQANRDLHDKDRYNFSVHIMFDDAFEKAKTQEGDIVTQPNKFVKLLLTTIPKAAESVAEGSGSDTEIPIIYPTEYGGRLDFVLPGGNLMSVHLKDKQRIRHKKRWSQCMYLYYIFGYLSAQKGAEFNTANTYILALDGDVDFQPRSMTLLLDRMKRNHEVGGVCGRIHPIGSGPVVWFQKFEYAVGHWLQKTTEHVLGCVLCSPGCFSLFRADALLEPNVMKTYTTLPTEALHYIQWNQGEDRWLCTLMLKAGRRIEYCAASDSYTYAPEDFKEFYNQRRRWGPSTMANIFDVLLDSKRTIKNNPYVSHFYIAYQIGLMVSTIIGPACVILIVQAGFAYVFGWNMVTALLVSLLPVVIFTIICFTTSTDIQIAVAGIFTIMYALVMMAVLVGIIGEMATTVLLNPNSLFMLAMIGIYAFTGIIHPTEMMCLIHGILYFLCVPSAFILLQIYSFCNMNDVTWGTREQKKIIVEDTNEVALKSVGNGKNLQIGPSSVHDNYTVNNGYYSCGCGNLFQCALCISPPESPRHTPVITTSILKQPSSSYLTAETKQREQAFEDRYVQSRLTNRTNITGIEPDAEEETHQRNTFRLSVSVAEAQRQAIAGKLNRQSIGRMSMARREELNIPLEEDSELDSDEDEQSCYWVVDGVLQHGKISKLDKEEAAFWKTLIRKYLKPLDENKADQQRIKDELKELRNKMTGAYFFINSLWITLTFALTLAIADVNVTFVIKGETIIMNPLALSFLLFFLVILIIQFFAMLWHRWSTFIHLLSDSVLVWNFKKLPKTAKLCETTMPGRNNEQPSKGRTSAENKNFTFGQSDQHRPSDNGSIRRPHNQDVVKKSKQIHRPRQIPGVYANAAYDDLKDDLPTTSTTSTYANPSTSSESSPSSIRRRKIEEKKPDGEIVVHPEPEHVKFNDRVTVVEVTPRNTTFL